MQRRLCSPDRVQVTGTLRLAVGLGMLCDKGPCHVRTSRLEAGLEGAGGILPVSFLLDIQACQFPLHSPPSLGSAPAYNAKRSLTLQAGYIRCIHALEQEGLRGEESLQPPVSSGLNSTSLLFRAGAAWEAALELRCRRTSLLTRCEASVQCHGLAYRTDPA